MSNNARDTRRAILRESGATLFSDLDAALEEQDFLAIMSGRDWCVVQCDNGYRVMWEQDVEPEMVVLDRYEVA